MLLCDCIGYLRASNDTYRIFFIQTNAYFERELLASGTFRFESVLLSPGHSLDSVDVAERAIRSEVSL